MTYGAMIKGRSGVPCTGGLCILLGFLLSPVKWLAFLCVIDYGIWYLPYMILSSIISGKKVAKKMAKCYEEGMPDSAMKDVRRLLVIRIPELNEELQNYYVNNGCYPLQKPKIYFQIQETKTGRKLLLLENIKSDVRVLDFNQDKLELGCFERKGKKYTVELEVTDIEKG
jgi:hypothetical protein